jgi:hypothetical protein
MLGSFIEVCQHICVWLKSDTSDAHLPACVYARIASVIRLIFSRKEGGSQEDFDE